MNDMHCTCACFAEVLFLSAEWLEGIRVAHAGWVGCCRIYITVPERLGYSATLLLALVAFQTGITIRAYKGSLLDEYDSIVLYFMYVPPTRASVVGLLAHRRSLISPALPRCHAWCCYVRIYALPKATPHTHDRITAGNQQVIILLPYGCIDTPFTPQYVAPLGVSSPCSTSSPSVTASLVVAPICAWRMQRCWTQTGSGSVTNLQAFCLTTPMAQSTVPASVMSISTCN